MSRRRASPQQLANDAEHNASAHTAPPEVDEKRSEQSGPQSSALGKLTWSWLERASLWFNAEIGRTLFDDKAYDSNKILPSLVSFILGLLLVKIYGDSLDSAIGRFCGHVKNAFDISYGLLARLTSRDFEIVTIVCVLVLLWIGAFRILANLVRQLVQTPRFCSYNS